MADLLASLKQLVFGDPLPPLPGPHTHEWVQSMVLTASENGVACQVMDCTCGARAKVYPGDAFGMSEIRIDDPNSGDSLANALLRFDGSHVGEHQLGDPQGDRIRFLMEN